MSWKQTVQKWMGRTRPTPVSSDNSTVRLPDSFSGPLPNAIWQRRYRVVKPLGSGGMGKAMLAERFSDSARVCLKFLNPDTERRLAEQECRALMRLRHPSIVSLLDFSLEDQPPWLATEYVAGASLHAHLKKHGPLPVQKATAVLTPLLQALEYAHSQEVIHRDLKPANLMIEGGENRVQVRVLDFGIAIIDRFDHQGNVTAANAPLIGTLVYMAPEQFRGEILTTACDIYSTGLMAWEMLMGRPPFESRTVAQLLYEKTTQVEGLTLDAGAVAPASLRSFVEACTRGDPGGRPTAPQAIELLHTPI